MTLETSSIRLNAEEHTLILNDLTSQRTLAISSCDDFVLYLGEKTDMRVLTPSAFTVSEQKTDCSIVRAYQKDGLTVRVTYRIQGRTVVKLVSVVSDSPVAIAKICTLNGFSSRPLSRGGEGQPIFFGEEFWGGIEFPAALNFYENDMLCCMQAPYEKTASFSCFPVVFGADGCGDLQRSFFDYAQNTALPKKNIKVYGDWGLHDELSGEGEILSEKLTFDAISRVAELNERCNLGIEYYLMDAFWFEENQPYLDFKKQNFPEGIGAVVKRVEERGMKFGLWLDLNMIHAHMKGGEEVSAALGNGAACFACEGVASLMKRAMLYHAEHNRVKMFKLDFAYFECKNPAHEHSLETSESKEKSVKNFLNIVAEIKSKYPDTVFLCYNGWTTDLDWIGSVKKRLGYAVSPYWARYVEYVYCGDPRPSEIASENLTDSVTYYTDAMIRSFLDAGMPIASVDDHGTMLGDTPTIYRQGKLPLRLGFLMNAMRGTKKLQLYGDLSKLDGDDKDYIAFVGRLFDESEQKGMRPSLLLGDARKGEPYSYALGNGAEGYAVVINPTPTAASPFAAVSCLAVESRVILRGGKLKTEPPICAQGGFPVRVEPYSYALVQWRVREEKRETGKIYLSAREALTLSVTGCRAASFTFTDGKDPVRTPFGLPEGVVIETDGRAAETTVRRDIWSGVSWVYVPLSGKESTIKILSCGGKTLAVKYELYGREHEERG